MAILRIPELQIGQRTAERTTESLVLPFCVRMRQTIPDTKPATVLFNMQIKSVSTGFCSNIKCPPISAPVTTAIQTMIPNTPPKSAPVEGPNNTAPRIMGTSESVIVNGQIFMLLARVCNTMTRAIKIAVPTSRMRVVLFVFIFNSPSATVSVKPHIVRLYYNTQFKFLQEILRFLVGRLTETGRYDKI